jgi:hypothetical protein
MLQDKGRYVYEFSWWADIFDWALPIRVDIELINQAVFIQILFLNFVIWRRKEYNDKVSL